MKGIRRISDQTGNHSKEKQDPKKDLREIADLILPDSLMIALAAIMIPVVLIPLLVDLPDNINTVFTFTDYTIIGIFIIEYFSKLFLAPDIIKHFLDPWHLLDLFIVIVPFIGFLPSVSMQLSTSSPLLRLLRIIRIFAVGGRAVDRRIQVAPSVPDKPAPAPLTIEVLDGNFGNTYEDVPIDRLKDYLASPNHTWVNISYVSESDLDQLSAIIGTPKILLESELIEESLPRLDYFEDYSMIFVRIADIVVSPDGHTHLSVKRSGLLVICHGQNIITISKTRTELFHEIVEQARKIHGTDDPVVVTILYSILKHILEKDKQIIRLMEQELLHIESIPTNKRPDDFLETTFYLRKEVNQMVPALLHLKAIISVIASKRVPLEGFTAGHEKLFDILADEATFLYETASNARDDLQSLVDLHINTTSFETNKVMRIIAIITSLSVVPAVMGLLGSNIVGNPWNIQLWQVFFIVGVLMLTMGWIFYRLGWLKG